MLFIELSTLYPDPEVQHHLVKGVWDVRSLCFQLGLRDEARFYFFEGLAILAQLMNVLGYGLEHGQCEFGVIIAVDEPYVGLSDWDPILVVQRAQLLAV